MKTLPSLLFGTVVDALSFASSMLVISITCIAVSGCVSHSQRQYFAVKDPDTGVTNYYRMLIDGGSNSPVKYKLQAGYFSAAAVDILRGKMPDIPSIDLTPQQQETFDALIDHFRSSLLQEARLKVPITDDYAALVPARGRLDVATRQEKLLIEERDKAKGQSDSAIARIEVIKKDIEAVTKESTSKLAKQLSNAENELVAIEHKLEDKKGVLKSTRVEMDAVQHQIDLSAKKPSQSPSDEKQKTDSEITANLKTLDQQQANYSANQKELSLSLKERDLALGKKNDASSKLADNEERLKKLHRDLDEQEALKNKADARLKAIADGEMASAENAKKTASDRVEELKSRLPKNHDANGDITDLASLNPQELESQSLYLANLVWYASLSDSDVASVGMMRDTNPYQFRKLVFWTTAQNININDLGTEIDGVIEQVVGLGTLFKQIRDAHRQEVEQKKAAEQKNKDALAKMMKLLPTATQPADVSRILSEMGSIWLTGGQSSEKDKE